MLVRKCRDFMDLGAATDPQWRLSHPLQGMQTVVLGATSQDRRPADFQSAHNLLDGRFFLPTPTDHDLNEGTDS